MLRRLPLLGTATPETPAYSGERALLGAGSIGIADTDSGQLAVRFACALAIAFARHATHVSLTVLSYQGVPVLDVDLITALAAAGISPALRSLAVGRASLADPAADSESGRPRVALFVGLPALGSYRPALSLLLGAERSVARWPPVLRGVRGQLSLALAGARPGLAPVLATALIERGFLPRE